MPLPHFLSSRTKGSFFSDILLCHSITSHAAKCFLCCYEWAVGPFANCISSRQSVKSSLKNRTDSLVQDVLFFLQFVRIHKYDFEKLAYRNILLHFSTKFLLCTVYITIQMIFFSLQRIYAFIWQGLIKLN